MLSVQHLRIAGRQEELVPPTSFAVAPGELLLVQADGQEHRTALALTASGRYAPDSGTARWGSPAKSAAKDLKELRKHSALVDAPGINEAEPHLSVRDLVAEDLALLPRRYRGAGRAAVWLKVNAFEDVAEAWSSTIPASRRIQLLSQLALSNPDVELLVLDSPDRHSDDPADWLPYLESLARREGRPLAVLAVVAAAPESWAGTVAKVGNAVEATAEATGTDVEDHGLGLISEAREESAAEPKEALA